MLNFQISEKEAEVLLILLGKLPTETAAYPMWDRLKKLIEESKDKK
jgi:hypothetical protein